MDFSKIKSKKEKEEDTSSSSSSDDDEEVQEPKKKENSGVPNRRESVDMPKLIDENSNQGRGIYYAKGYGGEGGGVEWPLGKNENGDRKRLKNMEIGRKTASIWVINF